MAGFVKAPNNKKASRGQVRAISSLEISPILKAKYVNDVQNKSNLKS